MQALQKIAYFNGLESYVAGDLGEAESSLEESLGVGLNAKYNALASFWLGEIAYASGRYVDGVAALPQLHGARTPYGQRICHGAIQYRILLLQ